MISIAIYGKGGIGKSTASANIACAMADLGKKVLLIGCDPKADSTSTVCGRKIRTILDVILTEPGVPQMTDFLVNGYNGVTCAETGGPKPGDGCAGRGVVTALRALREQGIFSDSNYDVVIFDVLGDVVCGGFSLPLKEGFADRAYIVTTCDFMAMYAANNICFCIEKFASRNGPTLGGIIFNERSVVTNPNIPVLLAEKLGTKIIGKIPADPRILKAELSAKTLVEAEPDSYTSSSFRAIASSILEQELGEIPNPMDDDDLDSFLAAIQEYYE